MSKALVVFILSFFVLGSVFCAYCTNTSEESATPMTWNSWGAPSCIGVTGTYYFKITVPSTYNGQVLFRNNSGNDDGEQTSEVEFYKLNGGNWVEYTDPTHWFIGTVSAGDEIMYKLIITNNCFGKNLMPPLSCDGKFILQATVFEHQTYTPPQEEPEEEEQETSNLGLGVSCSDDPQCESKVCDGGICKICESSFDCPGDNYKCNGSGMCITGNVTDRAVGQICGANSECITGNCDWFGTGLFNGHGNCCKAGEKCCHVNYGTANVGDKSYICGSDYTVIGEVNTTSKKADGQKCTYYQECESSRCDLFGDDYSTNPLISNNGGVCCKMDPGTYGCCSEIGSTVIMNDEEYTCSSNYNLTKKGTTSNLIKVNCYAEDKTDSSIGEISSDYKDCAFDDSYGGSNKIDGLWWGKYTYYNNKLCLLVKNLHSDAEPPPQNSLAVGFSLSLGEDLKFDDSTTSKNIIVYEYSGNPKGSSGYGVYSVKCFDLKTKPKVVCGDKVCNVDNGENCNTCKLDCGCSGVGQCCVADSQIMHSDSPTGCANSSDKVWESSGERIFCCNGKIGAQGTDSCCVNSDCGQGKECVNKVLYGTEAKLCVDSKTCTNDSGCSINNYCFNGECQDKPQCNGTIYSPNSNACCSGTLVKKGEQCSITKLSKNPQEVLAYDVTGMPTDAVSAYDKDNSLWSYFGLNLTNYTAPAHSWREISEYELRKGKRSLQNAKKLGFFNAVGYGLNALYKAIDFIDTIKNLPEQIDKLSNIKNIGELTDNASLLIDFTSSMASLSEVASAGTNALGIKITNEDYKFFNSLKDAAFWTTGTISSGGLSLVVDAANALNGDNVKQSILYETEVGEIGMFASIQTDIVQKIAEKENPTADDIKTYFYSIKKFLNLKKLEIALRYRDDVSIYKDNPDFMTQVFTFVEGEYEINKKIEESKANAKKMTKLYEAMEKNIDDVAKSYGVVLQ